MGAQNSMYSLILILKKKNCMYIHAETEKLLQIVTPVVFWAVG